MQRTMQTFWDLFSISILGLRFGLKKAREMGFRENFGWEMGLIPLQDPLLFSLGLVGLAISYALSVTDRLSGMVTSFTETEKQMVSVERAVQYIEDVPQEVSPHGSVSIHLGQGGRGGGLILRNRCK